MNFYDIEKADLLKRRIIQEQGGKCHVCKMPFTIDNLPELAHRICKSKLNLKRYGEKVIHHRENLRATHHNCNSRVLVNPDSLPGQRLILTIRAMIDDESN